MIVVADTTPLNYLVIIGQQEILPRLYGKVIIPQAVYNELLDQLAPEAVSIWIRTNPHWLIIQHPADVDTLSKLQRGEQEAISLAKELNADFILMDDRQGREEAMAQGLNVTGTIGILERAWYSGYLDLRKTLNELLQTNFHISNRQLQELEARMSAHEQTLSQEKED